MKINNTEWKIVNTFLYSVCLSISLVSIFPFVNKDIVFGVILLFGGMFVLILMLLTIGWPVTIKLEEENIIVYRFRKEINRIKWEQVTEIYEKDFVGRTNLAQFYFSDGQDRLLNDKNGNEHFITFRCAREKACLFSKFTDLPIQQIEHNK